MESAMLTEALAHEHEEVSAISETLSTLRAVIAQLDSDIHAEDDKLSVATASNDQQQQRLETTNSVAASTRDRAAVVKSDTAVMRADIDDFEERVRLHAELDARRTQLAAELGKVATLEALVAERFAEVRAYHEETLSIVEDAVQSANDVRSVTAAAMFFRGDAETSVDVRSAATNLESHAGAREEYLRELLEHVTHLEQAAADADVAQQSIEASAKEAFSLVQAYKAEQLDAFRRSHQHEIAALNKEKKKVENVTREISFHAKRGTINKRSTKHTAEEARLCERIADLHRDLQAHKDDFERGRNELVELERVATVTYDQLLGSRRKFEADKAIAEDRLKDVQSFVSALRSEHEMWEAAHQAMSEMMHSLPTPQDRRLQSA